MRLLPVALLFSLGFATLPPTFAADITDIEVEVIMDDALYTPGEPITATVVQCNPTDETITRVYGCPCCHDNLYYLDTQGNTIANCSGGCISGVVTKTWAPGECKSRNFTWSQLTPECSFGDQVPNGDYRAQHVFLFPDYELTTEGRSFVIGQRSIAVPSLSGVGFGLLALALSLTALLRLSRSGRI